MHTRVFSKFRLNYLRYYSGVRCHNQGDTYLLLILIWHDTLSAVHFQLFKFRHLLTYWKHICVSIYLQIKHYDKSCCIIQCTPSYVGDVVQRFHYVFRFQSSTGSTWQSAMMQWDGSLLTVQAGGPGSTVLYDGKQCVLLHILVYLTATNSCF